MTAPWSIKLDEDVLVLVQNNVVVVLCDNDSDGTVVLVRNGLALDARLNLAVYKVVEELSNVLLRELVTGVGKLLVLLRVLDGESGPLANLEVQVAGVLAERLCVDGGKVDLALVLLCDRLECGGERLALLGSLGEDVGKRNTSLNQISRSGRGESR